MVIVSCKDAKKKDCKVLFCIQSAVDSANFDQISHDESAKKAWDVLVKYYEGGEKVKGVKLQVLRRNYKLLQIGEDKKIAGYVAKVQNIIHLMKGCGETIIDKMIFEKKHDGCNKFRGKTRSKKSWSNPQKHKVNYEFSKIGEETLTNKEERKGVQCYNCEKWGHLAKHCWSRKDKGETKGKDEGENLARQDSDNYEDLVFMAAVVDEHVDSKIWFLDTGCSNHMTGRRKWLVDFEESKKRKIKLADNSSLQVEGTGDIVIQSSNSG
ncbi:uncharacterized protein LOC127088300 [Lathyrus oleraceus]|uniref:uncharacterized protein LOC127088300 n=1 Tax=Pisum sativum TaxID=3888 RepID=UPI0021CE011E|nr:uncharacterized protein LOC127088300 [Pisum sativum]